MKQFKKIPYLFLVFIITVSMACSPLLGTKPVSAVADECDEEFYSLNTILFYNKCGSSIDPCKTSASGSVFSNKNYLGNEIYSSAQLEAIEENKTFYEAAASRESIPWQIIAVIHGNETGFKRYGPKNGQGPYQMISGGYPVKDAYTDTEFQEATYDAAEFIKGKAGGRDLADPNNAKYTLFAYNGMAEVYKKQAKALGFSDEEANLGEGSPYVMNRFDEKRDPTVEPTKSNGTWGQIKTDGGSISYPANTHFGAFVQLMALTNGTLCGSGVVAKNGDANAMQALFTKYMNEHNERYDPLGYSLGYNGCTTLSSWFIGEYTSLTYGRGNGEAVVKNLVEANKDKGLQITNRPTAPAIFSVAGGVRDWGATGISPGHVGLVVSVNEESKTATVIHTGSRKSGQKEKAYVSQYKFPASGVTFVNIGEYIKE